MAEKTNKTICANLPRELFAEAFSMLLDISEALITALVSTKVWLNLTFVTVCRLALRKLWLSLSKVFAASSQETHHIIKIRLVEWWPSC